MPDFLFHEKFHKFPFYNSMKYKLIISGVLLVMCCLTQGQIPDSLKYKSLYPTDFQNAYRTADNKILIDVREFFEYRKSRLDGAVNIPSSGNLEVAADTLNKESSLFLYCTSGFRSKRVAKYFYDKGFLKLYSLDGGIVAWRKEGFPVTKKKIRKRT
jgi:thioredoxin 1